MFFGTLNQSFIDWPWTLVHLVSGAGIGLALSLVTTRSTKRRRLIVGVFVLVAWELAENILASFGLVEAEHVLNIVGDLVIGSFGILIFLR